MNLIIQGYERTATICNVLFYIAYFILFSICFCFCLRGVDFFDGSKTTFYFLKTNFNSSPPHLLLSSTFLCVGYVRHSADKMCTAVAAIKQICLFISRWDQHHNSKQNSQSITFKGISCFGINVALSPLVPLSLFPH